MLELDYLAWFMGGLLGGGHCIGMCGGIVMAFSLQTESRGWQSQLLFNSGRIIGYMLIGLLLGGLSEIATRPLIDHLQQGLLIFSRLLLIGMGLHIAGWSKIIRLTERAGAPIWRRIQPLMQGFLPFRHSWQYLAAGSLWGFLPCGLVYSASLAAVSSADAIKGALVMLAFGLGTLPNLLLMGAGNLLLRTWLLKPWIRRLSGGGLILLALVPAVFSVWA